MVQRLHSCWKHGKLFTVEGTFSIKTLLGRIVNGSCGDWKSNLNNDGCHFATVNRVFVESLELILEIQYKHDFKQRAAEEKEEMLRDEARFIEIMSQTLKLQDWHYSVKLPFKNKEAMSNNQCAAQQRLIRIQNKMERNEKFLSKKWSTHHFLRMSSAMVTLKWSHRT